MYFQGPQSFHPLFEVIHHTTRRSMEYVLGFINALIIFFGGTGNILIIVSLCYQRKLLKKNIHYYLVLHLAICDLVCLLFPVEDVHVSFGGKSFPFSTAFCKSWTTLLTTFFTMEVEVILIICAVRCRAVFYPLRAPLKRWQINVALAVAWVIAVLCVSPLFWLYHYSSRRSKCDIDWPGESFRLAYTLFLSAVQYFIPVLLLAFVYYQIYVKIQRQRRRRQLLMASTDARKEVQRRTFLQTLRRDKNGRIILISFVIVLCYAVCAFPMQCISILWATGTAISFKFYYASYVLFLAGVCSINPFIYKALDKRVFLLLHQLAKKTFGKKANRKIKDARRSRSEMTILSTRNTENILVQNLPTAPLCSE